MYNIHINYKYSVTVEYLKYILSWSLPFHPSLELFRNIRAIQCISSGDFNAGLSLKAIWQLHEIIGFVDSSHKLKYLFNVCVSYWLYIKYIISFLF